LGKKSFFSYLIFSQLKTFYSYLIIFLFIPTFLWAKKTDDVGYHRFTQTCMGTEFNLLIDGGNIQHARSAANQAFLEAHRINNILSDYLSESELSKFSQNSGSSKFYPLSNDLFYVLSRSQKLALETGGRFDITIGPLSRLWRIARFKKMLPSDEKLINAQKRVGYKNLILDYEQKKAKLLKMGMVLDLGGIAKGYAADQMHKILNEHNVSRFLIDAGGDLLAGQSPLGKAGWKVTIGGKKHPDLPSLFLSNVAIATSGDLEQSITVNGKTYSHLINPFSGLGLTTLAQVTVIAPTAITADSLASASLVLGTVKGIQFLKTIPNVSAYFLEQKGDDIILTQSVK
jgi:thiamine biosynthesis lipoprotein